MKRLFFIFAAFLIVAVGLQAQNTPLNAIDKNFQGHWLPVKSWSVGDGWQVGDDSYYVDVSATSSIDSVGNEISFDRIHRQLYNGQTVDVAYIQDTPVAWVIIPVGGRAVEVDVYNGQKNTAKMWYVIRPNY
jgi:hypothetical protein